MHKETPYTYSAKFSRRIIFAVFAYWPQTAKIKLAKCFVVYACIQKRASLVREVYFHEMVSMPKPRKLCASKIWRYKLTVDWYVGHRSWELYTTESKGRNKIVDSSYGDAKSSNPRSSLQ